MSAVAVGVWSLFRGSVFPLSIRKDLSDRVLVVDPEALWMSQGLF